MLICGGPKGEGRGGHSGVYREGVYVCVCFREVGAPLDSSLESFFFFFGLTLQAQWCISTSVDPLLLSPASSVARDVPARR